MKATELMVGDWVLDWKKPAQITGIMCDDLFETTLSPGVGGEYISPIPLTAEILERNGWRKPPIDYDKEARSEFWTCDCDWIIWEHHGFMLCHKEDFVGWGIELTYVHELQHALRLCNIEKEIEL